MTSNVEAMHCSLRRIVIIAGLLLAGVSGVSAQKNPEYIFPTAAFNEEDVARQMEDGGATIDGLAKLKKKGRTYFPWKGDRIQLYPVTPYLTEFLELQKKYRKGKKIASMSNTVFSYHIEGRVLDEDGHFQFRDVKPGKYYIVTWIDYEKSYQYKVQTGRETARNGYGEVVYSIPTYTWYTHKYAVEQEVSGIVEVTGDGKMSAVISN
ncbi:hypothetical protein HF324_14460 [Chitinophaga oryzae]|uniref:Carboxypeptidase regulatory-like domain-containing protein n=1 Tax=Chitinophaga oryzae TaxID=2725414 RepID=A0AAE6ZJG0_9BACT|nr:hypothetical protein [Chitinophaga oryzae]QJB32524.1 hypothetical protein HF329_14805 [Chitinophaga oryzae]QJB39000.1 hypothetical protein HF324_14460 [Chitinophaga oryzae]